MGESPSPNLTCPPHLSLLPPPRRPALDEYVLQRFAPPAGQERLGVADRRPDRPGRDWPARLPAVEGLRDVPRRRPGRVPGRAVREGPAWECGRLPEPDGQRPPGPRPRPEALPC